MLRIAEMLKSVPSPLWTAASQLGIKEAVASLPYDDPAFDYSDYMQMLKIYNRFKDFGFNVTVLEGAPRNEKIKLGLPGRDEEIEKFIKLLDIMSRLGIEIICYNFMPIIGWFRSSTSIVSRGGALVTGYDNEQMKKAPLTEAGEVSAEKMWENYEYFIKAVAPEAERLKVKLALHPDDPPVPLLRGLARIFIDADSFKRALAICPGEYHGMTYCQGCFSTMCEDIPATVKYFGEAGKIFFVHFRDVIGSAEKFQEVFQDAGKTDMKKALKAYIDAGVEAPIRVDHVPTMVGEDNSAPGYEMLGRIYAVGYLRGLLQDMQ